MTLRSIAVLAAALTLPPAAAEAKRFRTYVACGVADSTFAPPPSHSCPVGDLPHAVLIDRERSSTRYKLCVTVPSGQRYCNRRQTGKRGKRSQRGLYNESLGSHTISWYHGGRLLDRWTLVRTIGD
jgi:hypothetical protein